MKFLRALSVLAFFQVASFAVALPTYYLSLTVGHFLGILNAIFFVAPIIIALVVGFYLSKKFHSWLPIQSQAKQLYLGIPLIMFVALSYVMEYVPEANTGGIWSNAKRMFHP